MPVFVERLEKTGTSFRPAFGLNGVVRLNRPARLSLANNVSSIAEAPSEDPRFREDELGTMRGLAFAMLCNIILAVVAIAGWHLWRLFQ